MVLCAMIWSLKRLLWHFEYSPATKLHKWRNRGFPSLVDCLSTIMAHWVQKANRFFGHVLQSVIHYAGRPKALERIRSWSVVTAPSDASLVVKSFEITSNNLRYLEHIRWNYVVLDESHVSKNAKTKASKAVRSVLKSQIDTNSNAYPEFGDRALSHVRFPHTLFFL